MTISSAAAVPEIHPTALVEFVCIDRFVDGLGWVEWGCGYVTTC